MPHIFVLQKNKTRCLTVPLLRAARSQLLKEADRILTEIWDLFKNDYKQNAHIQHNQSKQIYNTLCREKEYLLVRQQKRPLFYSARTS